MNELATHDWMIETSMRNIMLVDKIRKQRESLTQGTSLDAVIEAARRDPQRIEFEFWSEFFLAATKDKVLSVRMPALVQNTGNPKPCHVTVHPGTHRDQSSVEIIEIFTSADRKFPVPAIRHVKHIDTPHCFDPDIEGSWCPDLAYLKLRPTATATAALVIFPGMM